MGRARNRKNKLVDLDTLPTERLIEEIRNRTDSFIIITQRIGSNREDGCDIKLYANCDLDLPAIKHPLELIGWATSAITRQLLDQEPNAQDETDPD